MDALLTLEKRLPRTVEQLKRRKQHAIDIGIAVLRPTELLGQLKVSELDDVPVKPGRFYSYMEIFQIPEFVLDFIHYAIGVRPNALETLM
jgi:hypothetical protein